MGNREVSPAVTKYVSLEVPLLDSKRTAQTDNISLGMENLPYFLDHLRICRNNTSRSSLLAPLSFCSDALAALK